MLRTPLRALVREDARAIWGAFWRIWAALAVIVALSAMALSPGGVGGSSWSDASTWTVITVPPVVAPATTTTKIARTCSFSGSLSAGSSTCTTTTRTSDGVTLAPGPDNGAFPFNTYWGIWTSAGCDAAINDSERCRALRYLLGYSIFTYILLSIALCMAVAALLQVSEALLQMYCAPEERVAEYRVANLWKWTAPLAGLTGMCAFTWPIVIVVALATIKEDTIAALELVNIDSQSTLVRPGASWWFVLISFCLCIYAAVMDRMLEKAYPHPETCVGGSHCAGRRVGGLRAFL
jgi:hypothetical protein